MFTIKEITEATKGKLVCGDKKTIIKGISTDTRAILTGELFVALKGDRFDGQQFLKDAFKKGARAAVVEKGDSALFPTSRKRARKRALPPFSLIKVNGTKRALGDIASAYRKRLKIPIVGITGSSGKTTTKDMIAHILSERYKVAKTPDTENNLIGVPLAILKIRNESYAVIEMGTTIPGEIDYLAKIVRPSIGLITNIGPSHLEGLKTQKNILEEKSRLFSHLERRGYAVINKDDRFLSSLKIPARGGSASGRNNKTLTFGITSKRCDYFADEITNQKNGVQFILNKRYKFRLPAFGIHNVYNALAAISVTSALGIDAKVAQEALLDFKPAGMRFNMCKFNGIDIINDAYNSNPQSMRVALETLCALKRKGRRIVAAADMLELGKDTNRLHYKVGRMIAKNPVDILITVGNLSGNMAKGAKDNGMDNNKVRAFGNQKEAAEYLIDISRPSDTILVKGSRAMKMEELIRCFITYSTR